MNTEEERNIGNEENKETKPKRPKNEVWKWGDQGSGYYPESEIKTSDKYPLTNFLKIMEEWEKQKLNKDKKNS